MAVDQAGYVWHLCLQQQHRHCRNTGRRHHLCGLAQPLLEFSWWFAAKHAQTHASGKAAVTGAFWTSRPILQAAPQLRSLRSNEQVSIAATAGLLSAASAGQVSDLASSLAEDLDIAKSTASADSLLLLASVQYHIGEVQAALLTLDDLDAADASPSTAASAKALAGWAAVTTSRECIAHTQASAASIDHDDMEDADGDLSEAADHFDTALAHEPSNVEVRHITNWCMNFLSNSNLMWSTNRLCGLMPGTLLQGFAAFYALW